MNKTTTQQQHPWKATLRTVVQTGLAVAAALVVALPYVSELVAEFWPTTPVIGWIATATAFIAALAGVLTRIAALPAVDSLLARIGLGSAPRDELDA